ncbi:MAG: DUF4091 domain-containing protein [Candidatus Hydrogenedentes bacterium]|nr:DUF4091 domain-containing protein [Candidatus Hydrogenedentota bacterium]
MNHVIVLRFALAWCVANTFVTGFVFAQDSTMELTPVPATVRVRMDGTIPSQTSATLHAARGEFESLQVVVTAKGGRLTGVDAEIGPFSNAAGAQLPPQASTLYRVSYVPVRYSAPRATEPPGLTPDPLVPLIDPYAGQKNAAPKWDGEKLEGAPFGAVPFEVWPGQHQPLWLDVKAPADAAPGEYTATLRVRAKESLAELPITLTVWDFALPSGPTHENHFGGADRVASYHKVEQGSDAYLDIEERYSQMFADHRINPSLPRRLCPRPGEDGSVSFDTAAKDNITAFVSKFNVTNIEIPHAPFNETSDRAKALAFYRSWYAFLADNGWADRSYLYMLDEPNTAEAYERVRELGALVREAEPRIRRLVVEQTYTQDPAWGTLEDSIDIWCPLFGFVDGASIDRLTKQGGTVWSYTALVQTAPPYHPEYEKVANDLPPFWAIDFPLASYRIAPWLNWRYGITGLLYWSSVYWGSPDRNPWQDPGFRVRWNGEGALLYPGTDAGIEGPVASIRLKALRDGMEDYEYFALLASLGKREEADAIVREAVPTWGTWNQDPLAIPALRERLAQAILAAKR